MPLVLLQLVIILIVVFLAALFRRRVLVAGGIALVAGVAILLAGAMGHFEAARLVLFEGLAGLAAIFFAGRREPQAAFEPPAPPRSRRWARPAPVVRAPVLRPPVSARAEPQPLPPIDEEQFLAWLKGRGLLNKSHTPEEMMDLRRQFLGMA